MPRMKTGIGHLSSNGYLDGQLLIAMPSMADPRFHRAVIYLCAHSEEGAMGLIINQRAPHITLPKLLEQLEITAGSSHPVAARGASMAVHCGGPVETSRGFVLHSSDYFAADSTLPINESMCLTATVDILRAIAKAAALIRQSWRWAMLDGRRASLSTKSNPTAGSIARRITMSCSMATLRINMPGRWRFWACTRRTSSASPVTHSPRLDF